MSMIEYNGKQYDLVRGTYNPIQIEGDRWAVVYKPLVGDRVDMIEDNMRQSSAEVMALFHAKQLQRR